MNVLKKRKGIIPNTALILAIGLLTSLSFCSARAQVNPVYQKMLINGWRYPSDSARDYARMTPQEIRSQNFRNLGYDDTTLAHLKRAGLDISKLLRNRIFNKKLWTALSDCIVIGTVSKITYPSWPRPWYHTVVYIHVEKFLRNDYGLPEGDIAALEESGPSGRPHIMVSRIGEHMLSVGEHVVLFLSARGLIAFAADNNLRSLYNELIAKSEVYFEILARYDIKTGMVFSRTKKESLQTVTDSVNSVLDVINRSVPINR